MLKLVILSSGRDFEIFGFLGENLVDEVYIFFLDHLERFDEKVFFEEIFEKDFEKEIENVIFLLEKNENFGNLEKIENFGNLGKNEKIENLGNLGKIENFKVREIRSYTLFENFRSKKSFDKKNKTFDNFHVYLKKKKKFRKKNRKN